METKQNNFNWKKVGALALGAVAVGGIGYGAYNSSQANSLGAENSKLLADKTALLTTVKTTETELTSVKTSLETARKEAGEESEKVAVLKATNEELLIKQAELDAKIKADMAVTDAILASQQEVVVDHLTLNTFVEGKILTNSKLEFLNEGKVWLKENEYEFEEKLIIPANSLKVEVSSVSNEKFAGEPALTGLGGKKGLGYQLSFKDAIPLADVSNENPLNIEFAGKDLRITKLTDSSVSLSTGIGKYMVVGDKFTIEDREIELKAIASKKAVVLVDGLSTTLSEGVVKQIGGLKISVEDILSVSSANDGVSSVTLRVATETPKTLYSGDNWVKGNSDWSFQMDVANGKLNSLSVRKETSFLNADNAIKLSGTLALPNEFAVLHFDKDVKPTMKSVKASFELISTSTTDLKTLKLKTDGKLLQAGTEEVSEAWIDATGKFYTKKDGKYVVQPNLKIVNDQFSLNVVRDADGNVLFGNQFGVVSQSMEFFGVTKYKAEANECVADMVPIGERTRDVLTVQGILVKAPTSSLASDELEFLVPSEGPKFQLSISRK